jgi:threonylcarbamoyladenosine tRNA methylthiotransferase MtaB
MNIYLDTVGCRLNQSEIDSFANQIVLLGHTVLNSPQDADVAILNTCAVTSAAVSDSRQKIRNLRQQGVKEIIVTGCWSTIFPDEVISLEGVSRVIPNQGKDYLIPSVFQTASESYDLEPIVRYPEPGLRFRTRALIKVQDGCDNHCTFCITRLARGRGRSRPLQKIFSDIQLQTYLSGQVTSSAKEIVLTGVHLGSWGQDLIPKRHLGDLIQSILDQFDIPRLRLSSLEPWDLSSDFFELWKDPRLCRQLHLPLQSGSESTLRRMVRRTSPGSFSSLVAAARQVIPDIAITTDLIAGFPGETDQEFEETLQFVREMNFSGGHVFTFSPRPGTAAARLPDQVPFPIRKERNARLRQILEASASSFQSRFIGQTLNVLWESTTTLGPDGWHLNGLTDNYLRIHTTSSQYLWNQITPVRITRFTERGLAGEVTKN